MKKILIAHELQVLLKQDMTFLKRSDVAVFTAASNDEMLNIHRTERVNLIVTQLDMPGMDTVQCCARIREEEDLRAVSMIMVCDNSSAEIERSSRCKANAVLLRPVHPVVLMVKAQQLLDIASRETYRVLLRARIDGQAVNGQFFCRSRNISATGMLIESDRQFTEGTRLSCSFFLPDAKRVEASGKIVRIIKKADQQNGHHYGFMFTDISVEAKQFLASFVEDKSQKEDAGELRETR